jgi:hypothetical protein
MENENSKLRLPPVLQAAKLSRDPNHSERLLDMQNDEEGIRMFLLGGQHHEGFWPAGSISIRAEGDDVLVTLSIHSLEVECKYRASTLIVAIEAADKDLRSNQVQWQMDYRGRQRIERRLSTS